MAELAADNGAPTPTRGKQQVHGGPTLAQLYDMDQSLMCAPSVEKGFRAIWPRYLDYRRISEPDYDFLPTVGLGLFEGRTDLKNGEDYQHEVVDGFIEWLASEKVGPSVMKKAKSFLNTHLRCEHYCRLKAVNEYPQLLNMTVGKGLAVQKSVKSVSSRAAAAAIENCLDLQAELEVLVPDTKIREMNMLVFIAQPGGAVAKLDPLHQIYFACHYNEMSQTTRRGEELYVQRVIQRSTTTIKELGQNGVETKQLVTNKAKHNQDGWLEWTCTAPHMDPLRDGSSWHGLKWLYQFCVAGMVLPSFLNCRTMEDFKRTFGLWTYPSLNDPTKTIDSSQFSDNFRAFYADAGVITAKVTHQPRLQAVQEMDRRGIAEPIQRRMTGHKGKEQTVHQKNYANQPPTQGILQRAGWEPDDAENYDPVQFMSTPRERHLLDELCTALIPSVVVEHQVISERYETCSSQAARNKQRLTTLNGMLRSILYEVRHCLIMLACPILDVVTYAVDPNNQQSLWELVHNEDLAVLLNKQPFRSPQFVELQKLLLDRLLERDNFMRGFDGQTKSAVEKAVVDTVKKPLIQMHRQGHWQTNYVRMEQKYDLLVAKQNEFMNQVMEKLFANSSDSPTASARPTNVATPSPTPTPIPVHLPTPGSPMRRTLADGVTPRKRQAPMRQHQAISREYKRRAVAGDVDGPELTLLCDKHCFTLEDYWTTYKSKWQPLEEETNGGFRADYAVGEDGTKKRQNSAWWTQRSPMFRVIQHHMESMSETDALAKANQIFKSVRVGRNKKRPIKDLGKAFKAELQRLGIHHRGRPKGRKTAPR